MGSWAIFREPAVLGGWPSCCVRPPDFLASSSGRALYPVPTTRYWTVSSRPCRIPWMGRPTVKPARVGLELVSVEPRHPKPYPSSDTQVVGHGRGAATCRGAARSGGPSGRRPALNGSSSGPRLPLAETLSRTEARTLWVRTPRYAAALRTSLPRGGLPGGRCPCRRGARPPRRPKKRPHKNSRSREPLPRSPEEQSLRLESAKLGERS